MLAPQDLQIAEVDRFICHPGGAKVVDAIETALSLPQGSLSDEREVLRLHGNMSAPTALFVLDRARKEGLPPLSVMTALGTRVHGQHRNPAESGMTLPYAIMIFVTLQRLSELVIAHINTKALLAAGATEFGRSHYPVMVLLHASWLAVLWATVGGAPVNLPLLAVFAVLQMLRVWVLATLGRRWTTRIIVPQSEPMVLRGPFRIMRHPNYAVVIAEIAILPLVFGLVWVAAAYSVLNAAMLWVRIRAENAAYSGIRT